jgi:hypothetical protein
MVLYSSRPIKETSKFVNEISLNNIKNQLDDAIIKKNRFLYIKDRLYDDIDSRNICGVLVNYFILPDNTIAYEFNICIENESVSVIRVLYDMGLINIAYINYNLDPVDCHPELSHFYISNQTYDEPNLNIILNKLEYQELKNKHEKENDINNK